MFENAIYLCYNKKESENKYIIVLPRSFVMTSNKPRDTRSHK